MKIKDLFKIQLCRIRNTDLIISANVIEIFSQEQKQLAIKNIINKLTDTNIGNVRDIKELLNMATFGLIKSHTFCNNDF